MYGEASYSELPEVEPSEVITDRSSDFLRTVNGRDASEVVAVLNEIMDALQVLCPKLYEAAMRKLKE